jgi:hypothetical protein
MSDVIIKSQSWFTRVILGLNLCPFAHQPHRAGTIRWLETNTNSEATLIKTILAECEFLKEHSPSNYETSLIIAPDMLKDFLDFHFFIEEANYQLKKHGWEGTFQLAHFHPDYCFAHCEPDDPGNLTNRSPYPTIHILREQSLSTLLDKVDTPENIPEENMKKMRALDESEIKAL